MYLYKSTCDAMHLSSKLPTAKILRLFSVKIVELGVRKLIPGGMVKLQCDLGVFIGAVYSVHSLI